MLPALTIPLSDEEGSGWFVEDTCSFAFRFI